MIHEDSDYACPPWAHRCGYPLVNGQPCQRLVADQVGALCFPHAVQAGHLVAFRCTKILKSGEFCGRYVRKFGGRCWQHSLKEARDE